MMTDNPRSIWDAYWHSSVASEYINHTPELLDLIRDHVDIANCAALEIGAGTGGNSIALAGLGVRVFALDFSEPAVRRILLNANQKQLAIQVVNASAYNIPFAADTFDLIFHQGFLEHFRNPTVLLLEQARVLRAGGMILVDVPQRYNLYTIYKKWRMRRGTWDAGGWETEFSHSELSAILEKCGFEIVASYGRGVFPYLVSGRNQLKRLENLFFKSKGFPSAVWNFYDNAWYKLQHSIIGLNTLVCVGVLARKL